MTGSGPAGELKGEARLTFPLNQERHSMAKPCHGILAIDRADANGVLTDSLTAGHFPCAGSGQRCGTMRYLDLPPAVPNAFAG